VPEGRSVDSGLDHDTGEDRDAGEEIDELIQHTHVIKKPGFCPVFFCFGFAK
jgi:hypothetical protein